jgi:hypothetical protein
MYGPSIVGIAPLVPMPVTGMRVESPVARLRISVQPSSVVVEGRPLGIQPVVVVTGRCIARY